jgi:hypothetical protein
MLLKFQISNLKFSISNHSVLGSATVSVTPVGVPPTGPSTSHALAMVPVRKDPLCSLWQNPFALFVFFVATKIRFLLSCLPYSTSNSARAEIVPPTEVGVPNR